MVPTEYGQVAISLQIGDQRKLMIIDTGAWFSFLGADTVASLKLPTRSMSDQFVSYDASGHRTSTVATAPSISIGPLQVSAVDFVVAPPSERFGANVSGLLGANVLKHFDIDFDFANKKVNFFSQDHCPGQVVYWTQNGSARIPFKFDGSKISLPVQLDGHELWAMLDTGAFASTISAPIANQVFDLTPSSPGVDRKETTHDDGTKSVDATHVFGALGFGGVMIANPRLHLLADKMGAAARADNARTDYTDMPPPHLPALLLGMAELRQLHLYIAYGEKTLYVTAADAH
jgi:predicted aspartyl protease